MLKIVVVDDSPTARTSLSVALSAESDLQVVGEASTGVQALRVIERTQPDLVTMDVHLAGESGLDVAARIMESRPTPILVITGVNAEDPALAFEAISAGGLEVLPKLPSPQHPRYEVERTRLVRTIRSLSSVPVVTRRRRERNRKPISGPPSTSRLPALLIGASTGGPPLLQELLGALPAPAPFPILIVQHIFPSFAEGLASWLADTTPHRVELCENSRPLLPGDVLLPPGDRHLVVRSDLTVGPSDESAHHHQRPSVDALFMSGARHLGSQAVGVLLTGMGSDGAEGLLQLRQAGAVTVAQEPQTCVVASMPRSAIRMNAAQLVLPPDRISTEILRQARILDGVA